MEFQINAEEFKDIGRIHEINRIYGNKRIRAIFQIIHNISKKLTV